MNSKEINNYLPLLILVGVGFVGYKFLQKIGLVKTNKEVTDENNVNNLIVNNAFDRTFWKQGGPGTLILTAISADYLVKSVYDSKGWFNDDEDKLYGVFKGLKTKSQVSYLSDIFWNKYKKDMISFIMGFLSNSDLVKLYNIIDKLPNFKA